MTAETLLFPLGHYMGEFHPKTGAPMKYRRLRLGVGAPQLKDDPHFTMWAMAHGLPEPMGRTPWTREAAIEAAGRMGMSNAEQLADELKADGTVAEVTLGTPAAVEFARTHRLLPLMMGLGNTPEDRLRFGIGFVGTPPAVKVDSFVFEIWQWSRLHLNLWQTAQEFAKVEQKFPSGKPDSSPEGMLGEILSRLHVLLAANAAYVDQSLEGAPTEEVRD